MQKVLAFWLVLGTQAVHVIHVATTGNDNNTGTSQLLCAHLALHKRLVDSHRARMSSSVQRRYVRRKRDAGRLPSIPARRVRHACIRQLRCHSNAVGDVPVRGWRPVRDGDAAWPVLDGDARANVAAAPLPADIQAGIALVQRRKSRPIKLSAAQY